MIHVLGIVSFPKCLNKRLPADGLQLGNILNSDFNSFKNGCHSAEN